MSRSRHYPGRRRADTRAAYAPDLQDGLDEWEQSHQPMVWLERSRRITRRERWLREHGTWLRSYRAGFTRKHPGRMSVLRWQTRDSRQDAPEVRWFRAPRYPTRAT